LLIVIGHSQRSIVFQFRFVGGSWIRTLIFNRGLITEGGRAFAERMD
jgi:hypothetical protein